MNAFKKKALVSAVVAGFGMAAGVAQAVYLNPSGNGSTLIYPYYTVQSAGGNAYNTYVSVVNTTDMVKVVKVRFREGKNSREVLDFNLYLSPNDMWTGAVVPAGTGASDPGRLITADNSCTNPAIPATGVNFRNYEYSGARDDDIGTGLERTREGYLEMIEMGELNPNVAPGSAAVHDASGVPDDCPSLRGAAVPAVAAAIVAFPPTGGLNGTGTLINVNNGADMGYNAIALDQTVAASIYAEIGNDDPNFSQFDAVSAVISGQNAFRSDWVFGEDAVSALFMHTDVINEYVLDDATLSNTDWVMTFPTKRYYTPFGLPAIAPFTEDLTADGACEEIAFTYFNREEAGQAAADGDFSPLPPGGAASALCWESTVLSIRNGADHMPTGTVSGVLGSVNSTTVQVDPAFQNGWANLNFTGVNAGVGLITAGATSHTIDIAAATVSAPTVDHTYLGLPVTGFMVRTFNNGTLTCGTASCQGNYGSLFDHKFRQDIF